MASQDEIIHFIKSRSTTLEQELIDKINSDNVIIEEMFYKYLNKHIKMPNTIDIINRVNSDIQNEHLKKTQHIATTKEIYQYIVNKTGVTPEQILEDQKNILSILKKSKGNKIPINDIINLVDKNVQELIKTYILYAEGNVCKYCTYPSFVFNLCTYHYDKKKNVLKDYFFNIFDSYLQIKKLDELAKLIKYNVIIAVNKTKVNRRAEPAFKYIDRPLGQAKIIGDIMHLLFKTELTKTTEKNYYDNLHYIINDDAYLRKHNNATISDKATVVNINNKPKKFVTTVYDNNMYMLNKLIKILKDIPDRYIDRIKKKGIDIGEHFRNNINAVFDNFITDSDNSYTLYEEVFKYINVYNIKNIQTNYQVNRVNYIRNKYPCLFIEYELYGEIYNNIHNDYVPFVIQYNSGNSYIKQSFCLVNGINYLKLNKSDDLVKFFDKITMSKNIKLM